MRPAGTTRGCWRSVWPSRPRWPPDADDAGADGHEVLVFERGDTVAGGASFAHTGIVSPGHIAPWTQPGLPRRLVGQCFARHAALRAGPWTALRLLPWGWRWWRACQPGAQAGLRPRLLRLAEHSRDRLEVLRADLRLDTERSSGHLVLLRSEGDLRQARAGIKLLSELSVPFELLDAERVHAREPGINRDTAVRAAIHLPRDGVLNCRQFAHGLKAEAQRLGATFHFGRAVSAVRAGTPATLVTAQGEERVDAVVVCAGAEARPLLVPLGLRLPLEPVWGYSLTAPLRHVDGHGMLGPRAALSDERHRVALVRLGQRVRVAGLAELGGRADRNDPRAVATLYQVLHDWFPGAAPLAQAQTWKGARPMLPDGLPVIGAAGRPGVWLNLGHGASGWALSAGSARLLADLIAQRQPAVDAAGFGIERWA